MNKCSVDGCTHPYYARGFCNKHYQRWKKTGDPLIVRPHAVNSGSFKKGMIPHNKGEKADEESLEHLRKIGFQKGHTPWSKGKKLPDSQIEKMKAYRPTQETVDKIKDKRAKQVITEAHKRAISEGAKGRKHSPETIAKISGPNNYHWKGGSNRPEISRTRWHRLRLQVIERDNYRCQVCGKESKTLVVHHIIPYNEYKLDTADDLESWCRSCHTRFHTVQRHFKNKQHEL